jgi:hypothetical protein
MFYALCVTLCLAVLFMVMAGASLACTALLRLLGARLRQATPWLAANLLFALRALPLLLALTVTFGFVLPAFLKFEPRSTRELMGWPLMGLSLLGCGLVFVIATRSLRLISGTRRVQKEWRLKSTKLQVLGIDVPLYEVEGPVTLMAVSGIFRPKIFVGRLVAESLSSTELSAALVHEMAHVRSLDNLKQFLLRITRISRKEDVEWTNASEMAADEAAVACGASVLDLSSALIKVGRLGKGSLQDAVIASHLLPASACGSVEMRATHLQKLMESDCRPQGRTRHEYYGLALMVLLLALYVTSVNSALPWIHEALEFLVR